MSGLHFIDFNPNRLEFNKYALAEYNRLREKVGLDKFSLDPPKAPLAEIFPKKGRSKCNPTVESEDQEEPEKQPKKRGPVCEYLFLEIQ